MAGSREVRTRTLTEKGESYKIDLLSKRFQKSVKAVNKRVSALDAAVKDANYRKVEEEINRLDDRYNDYLGIVGELGDMGLVDEFDSTIQAVNLAVVTSKMAALTLMGSASHTAVEDERVTQNSETKDSQALQEVGTINGQPEAPVILSPGESCPQGIMNLDSTVLPQEVVTSSANIQEQQDIERKSISSRSSSRSSSRASTAAVRASQSCVVKTLHGSLLRQMALTEQVLGTADEDEIKRERDKLDRVFSDLMDAYLKLVEISGDTKEILDIQQVDASVFALKKKTCSWLIDHSEKLSSKKSSKSSSSGRSSRSSSGRSSRSSNSSGSKSTHSSASAVEQRAKTAALKAEADALRNTIDDRVEAEAKKKKEKIKTRIAKIDVKIAKSQAMEQVLSVDAAQPPKASIVKHNTTQKSEKNVHHTRSRTQDEKGEKEVTHNQLPGSNPVLSQEVVQLLKAPIVDMDVFSGDPLEYEYFKASFTEVVEKTVQDQRGRLARLIKYTDGDVKEMIKPFVLDDPLRCYDNAICLLDKEYGNPNRISSAYMKQLRDWPSIKISDIKGLKKLHLFLMKCNAHKRKGRLVELDSAYIIKTVVTKLDQAYHEKWRSRVESIWRERSRDANFDDLVEFIDFIACSANNPSYSRDVMKEMKNFRVHFKEMIDEKSGCGFCKTNESSHTTDTCPLFIAKDVSMRHKMVYEHWLCFGCLKPISDTHYGKICPDRPTCRVCKKQHPTVLHNDKLKDSECQDKTTKASQSSSLQSKLSLAVLHGSDNDNASSLCIVPVYLSHQSNPEKSILVYALLDNDCTGCFCVQEVLERLAPEHTRKAHVSIETLNGRSESESLAVNGLVVRCGPKHASMHAPVNVCLPTTYSCDSLPLCKSDIPTPSSLQCWPHLQEVASSLPEFDNTIPFGLMIGGNCPEALMPLHVIPSKESGPFAMRTHLGWCVVGPTGVSNADSTIKCHLTRYNVSDVISGKRANHHFTSGCTVRDQFISNTLTEMYNTEFNEVNSAEKGASREDKRFVAILKDNIKKTDGHYEVPLPFREDNVVFPNNKVQAICRLQAVKKKMSRNNKYQRDYVFFMEKLIAKGYARKCSYEKVGDGKLWYLPHHGVYHPLKAAIRVVFDCSARFEGRSLNDELLQGPDLANHLVGVLLRFRKEKVPFTADIEAMYHQIKVPTEQRSFLRFLWWPNGDTTQPIEEFEMCAHIFGAISSPSCANFTLRYTAQENIHQFGKDVCDTILRNFYIDDLLRSSEDDGQAVSLLTRVQSSCAAGGFNLTKVMSTSHTVLNSIPPDKRAVAAQQLEIGRILPVESALGVRWLISNDTLSFRVSMEDNPLTRRGILSTISSAFDPLGLVSPFLLRGRKILQEITADSHSWDDEVTSEQRAAWEDWRKDLPYLIELKVQRCYKPASFGDVIDISLHHFGDGTINTGYGTCHYIRQVSKSGQINVCLVMAKSRVSPLKAITIPRIELTSAKTAAEVGAMVKLELDFSVVSEHFWLDSKVALGYIYNERKRFRIFVANRVASIRALSEKEKWKYVESHANPADLASRGMSPRETDKVKIWFAGPKFLWKPEREWNDDCIIPDIPDGDNEVKACKKANMMKIDVNDILSHLSERMSQWEKMVRVLALVIRFCQRCRKTDESGSIMISAGDIKHAKIIMLQMVQKRYMNTEIQFYRNKDTSIKQHANKYHKQEGNLWKLDPFVDSDNLLKVGGRLRKSEYEESVKHPVILPKKSLVVQRIIEHEHRAVGHGGRAATLNAIRTAGYWLISGSTRVSQAIFRCVTCRKYRGRLGQQKMADLPEDRTAEVAPFTHCGLDMFGPFRIKDGRKTPKRHVALFTCFASRAVHLECTTELSTDAFILALRRFLARRGPAKSITSDNGTNFVGAANEFKKAYDEMDHESINKFLVSKSCDWIRWKRNPPEASHMGGVWERQIRTVRKILTSLLDQHSNSLSDESFRTLLTEAEVIVNSRPLTTHCLSDPTMQPLSPQQLLTMKSEVVLPPPGIFQKGDTYCRRRWRHVQHLANEFWTRWRKEYLNELQARQKWTSPQRNFKVNDIVMLKDSGLGRQQWPIARIVEVFVDPIDSLVRSVELKTTNSVLKRPIQKLVLLLEAPDECKAS